MSDYRRYELTEQQIQHHLQNMKNGVAVDRAIHAFMSLDEPYDFYKKLKMKKLLNRLLVDEDFGDVCKCMKNFIGVLKKLKKAAAAKLAENEASAVPETAAESQPTVVNNRKRRSSSPAKVTAKRQALAEIQTDRSTEPSSSSGHSLVGDKKNSQSSSHAQKVRPLGKMNTAVPQTAPKTARGLQPSSTTQPSTSQPRKKKQQRPAPMMAKCRRIAKHMRW